MNADVRIAKLEAALLWYEDHARYIAEKLHGKKVAEQAYAIEASIVALALDGGKRAREARANDSFTT